MTRTLLRITPCLVLWLTAACATANMPAPAAPGPAGDCFAVERLDAADRARADSLLAHALDNEALFTLAGPLKPMSSVREVRLRTARHHSTPAGSREVVAEDSPDVVEMRRYQRVANALSCGTVHMIVVPYRMAQDSIRVVQISVVDRALFDEVIRRDQAFWAQWGIVPGSDPGVVVTVNEFGEPYDRFRGYGYLFGYPEHAVTFFVEAAREGDARGELVARDFLQIPVHSRERGRFVYAVPTGHSPNAEDEAIRARAATILEDYRSRRERFLNADGTLRAVELLRDWYAAGRFAPRPPE